MAWFFVPINVDLLYVNLFIQHVIWFCFEVSFNTRMIKLQNYEFMIKILPSFRFSQQLFIV